MIQKFTISRDDAIYEAFPDVTLLPSGKMLCVFAECTHHADRSYTRIMLTESTDQGRTWSFKRPLTEATHGMPYYNCARISTLRDGRVVVIVDRVATRESQATREDCHNLLYFSSDDGVTWDGGLFGNGPVDTPARGIVPDKLLELPNGRWIVAAHYRDVELGFLVQRLWYSDDQGQTWSDPVIVGRQTGLNLCEVSILPIEGDTLVAFMRENSGQGWDCYKAISHDNGESWSSPIAFPLPGCHRPVAGWLNDGHILITHRFMQG
ncbi:MAG: exo-alpha-sialidase, partial [Anaerolineae bacterium]|nr:exo-alpha-sialidase [Anaerolineae bacterium]